MYFFEVTDHILNWVVLVDLMKTKDDVSKEYEQRIQALEKKFSFEKGQLDKRQEHERKVIDDRYSKILKSFETQKPN